MNKATGIIVDFDLAVFVTSVQYGEKKNIVCIYRGCRKSPVVFASMFWKPPGHYTIYKHPVQNF